MRWTWSLFIVIGILIFSNILVSSLCGLGDAEALYYSYSRNLSLSYLDHPPLIGWLIRGSTTLWGQTVLGVRAVAMGMCALSLILTTVLTREMYGDTAAGLVPFLMLATPIFAVGMTAATPDAPLSVLWPLITLQLYRALYKDSALLPSNIGARLRPLAVGLLLGCAFLAKYTGALLVVTTLILVLRKKARRHLRRPELWASAIIAAVVATPVFYWNITHDWAGVMHRLVWTQQGAGFSFRNVGALIGGQLLYVGPLMLWLFFTALKAGFRQRGNDANVSFQVLAVASLPTLVTGYLLVLWSDVAEPHWPAAGYLPLFPLVAHHVTQKKSAMRRMAKAALLFGGAVFIIMHLLVLTPLIPMLTPVDQYEPKYDLANELTGWPEAADLIRRLDKEGLPVTAGFYTQCAQLQFALNRPTDPPVRCISNAIDDFDIWQPSTVDAPFLFVDDNRFNHDVTALVPGVSIRSTHTVDIYRGARLARQFVVQVVEPIQ